MHKHELPDHLSIQPSVKLMQYWLITNQCITKMWSDLQKGVSTHIITYRYTSYSLNLEDHHLAIEFERHYETETCSSCYATLHILQTKFQVNNLYQSEVMYCQSCACERSLFANLITNICDQACKNRACGHKLHPISLKVISQCWNRILPFRSLHHNAK